MFPGFMSCNLTKRFRPAKGVLIMLAVILMFFALTSSALAEGKTPGQNDWQFFTQFNLWTPDITTETTTGTEIKIGIDEIIENLDLVYMGTFGASKGKCFFLVVDQTDRDFQTII